ncbi:MAG: AhpC/TSA family protein [Myxococcales bacterium]|nr:AhpC/TSA family protein [Myxococcales bacterium]
MNRVKSVFIGVYPMVLMAILGLASWRIARSGAWQSWMGPLLTAAPFAAVLTRVMLWRDVARTSASFPWLNALAALGVAASALAWWRAQPEAAAALGVAALGAATFALYSLWYSRLGRAPSGKLTVGQRLPALELLGADGEPYSTSALAGHPALLFFYRGNWCPLCMAQIKEVAGHYRELSALGAKVVLISPQPHGNTAELARRFDVSFDFVTDVGNRAARALDLEMKDGLPMGMGLLGYDHDTVFPTVLVLDRDGVIRWADQTDNYRVRPEPSTFLPLLRELAAQKPRRQAA